MEFIEKQVLDNALSYDDYRHMTDQLLAQQKTTGTNHSDAMIEYTKMNVSRMNRLDKTTKLIPILSQKFQFLNYPITWLVLSEAWCGDAAQILPVLNKLANLNESIDLKIILRDEHPDIMNAFLTNGGRGIPKLIFVDQHTSKVLGSWGPRPRAIQGYVLEQKAALEQLEDAQEKKVAYDAVVKNVHSMYAKAKTKNIQEEVLEAFFKCLELELKIS